MVLRVNIAAILVAASVVAMPSAAAAEKAPKAPKDPNEVVCKTERFVGSNRTRRLCLTRAEWDDIKFRSSNGLQERIGKLPYDRPTAGQGG